MRTLLLGILLVAILGTGAQASPTAIAALGIEGESVTLSLASSQHLSAVTGVLVSRVAKGGPAVEAGIAVGDVIVAIGGYQITNIDQLADIAFDVGRTVRSEPIGRLDRTIIKGRVKAARHNVVQRRGQPLCSNQFAYGERKQLDHTDSSCQ